MLFRTGEGGQTLEHFPKKIVNAPGLPLFKRHLATFGLVWSGQAVQLVDQYFSVTGSLKKC